jgi:acetyl esterase/lipase
MKPDPEAKDVQSPRKGPLDPYPVTFTAEADGKDIATATLELLLVSPEVIRTEVREKGLAGTFFRPAGKGRSPGVIMLGGSGGGLFEPSAALLASRGYAVFALAYFNYEKLPTNLVEIPLEYFETALDWMRAQESVQGDRLAVMGMSRGGELALLLGATFPKIKAVVAHVPSHVVWPGYSADSKDNGRPAWTYKGKPVPYMSTMPDRELVKLASIADPAVGTPFFALSLANTDAVRQAAIPVERIQGPVLLISGEDDKLWPSAYMANQVMKRLAEHKHPYPDKHFPYKGCGHMIGIPNMPAPSSRSIHPVSKVEMEMGGTPEPTAFAAWHSRQRVLEFLEKNLNKPE